MNQPLPSEKIEHVFDSMQLMYAKKWMEFWMFDEEMQEAGKRFWDSKLSHYSIEKINQAIDICFKEKKSPPTLPEFIEFCERKPISKPLEHRDALANLPAPEPVNEERRAEFKKRFAELVEKISGRSKIQ